jgi:hypothetical protein
LFRIKRVTHKIDLSLLDLSRRRWPYKYKQIIMKYLQRLFIFLTLSAAVFSCSKEYSLENHNGNTSSTAQWSFTEGSAQFKGPIDTVAIDTVGTYKFLTINGHSADKTEQITLQVFGTDVKVGTYKTPFSLFAYLKDGKIIYQTNQTLVDSFTIVISKLDSTGIEGTFSGKTYDSTKTIYKTIVDGKFASVFKTANPVPPVSADSGQVVLWSKSGCGGGTGPVTVSVGTKSGTISQFFGTEPTTCDPAGAFSVKLPVGSYPLVATCGGDSITGTVTVVKNACTKVLIDLTGLATPVADYFPTTKNSNWSYLDENSTPGDTIYTLSTGLTGTLSGSTQIYNLFTDDYGPGSKDSAFYRKASGTYWAYSLPVYDTAGGITNIPGYEYIFLKDNVAATSTFSSGPFNATVFGSAGSLTLNSTILSTGTSETVSAIPFTNVIKVRTVYSFKVSNVSTNLYAIEQWFSKGVGLIKYVEYDTAPLTTPDYVYDLTRYTVN